MNKKHIRTIIIFVLVLMAAIIAIVNIDIEPANRGSKSFEAPSTAAVTQKQAEPADNENELSVREQTPENKEANHSGEQISENNEDSNSGKQTGENTIPEAPDQNNEQPAVADVPPVQAEPAKPQEHFCTIEIRCDTVKDTSKLENQAVAPYVPENGVILPTTKIKFTPGESVFDILLRATKERNIHMEFRSENVYNGGKYIEGINYLYEMDGGPLSGWMYKVNGKFPNYGCGSFEVKDGDAIVWMYSCDLGADVGDNSTW